MAGAGLVAQGIIEAIGGIGAGIYHIGKSHENDIATYDPGASSSTFALNPMAGYLSGVNPSSSEVWKLNPSVRYSTPKWARRMMMAGQFIGSIGSLSQSGMAAIDANTESKTPPQQKKNPGPPINLIGLAAGPTSSGISPMKSVAPAQTQVYAGIKQAPGYFEFPNSGPTSSPQLEYRHSGYAPQTIMPSGIPYKTPSMLDVQYSPYSYNFNINPQQPQGFEDNSFYGYGRKGIYIKPSKRGTFTAWCKRHGYGGVNSSCISSAKSKGGAVAKKAVFAQNARKWKKGEDGLIVPMMQNGGVVGMEPVVGAPHEAGGVKQIINGLQVELEGGELKIYKEDGTVVVLNADQQERWMAGEPLEDIEQELPLYDQKAQGGTQIPWEMTTLDDDYLKNAWASQINPTGMEYLTKKWNPLYNEFDQYVMTDVPQIGGSYYRFTDAPNRSPRTFGIQPTFMKYLTKDIPETRKYDFKSTPRYLRSLNIPRVEKPVKKSVDNNVEETTTTGQPYDKFFDAYKKNLKMSALHQGLLSVSNIIDAAQSLANQKVPKMMPENATIPPFISPPLTSPIPYLEALKQSAATMAIRAREMGRPELIDKIGADLAKGVMQIGQQVPAANVEAFSRAAADYTDRLSRAEYANLQEKRFAKTLKAREDELYTNAQFLNRDAIYKSAQRLVDTGSQMGQGLLSANIMKYNLDTEDDKMLKKIMWYSMFGQD